MKTVGLSSFISKLEQYDELIRIQEFIDPVLEISEITDRVSKLDGGGKALLFENNGTKFPVLINAFGSEKRICLALGVDNFTDITDRINSIATELSPVNTSIIEKLKLLPRIKNIASWIPREINRRGICQQEIIDKPDLNEFPILKCWPYDGGRFITLPVVHTKSLSNNIRNVGMYRMQQFSKDETGMHWHRHKGGAEHFKEYKEANKKMPIAVVLGGDPVYTYVATAPLPDNVDEHLFAGFLRNKRVELVKCITQDIYVPQDADIVIEGYVDPNEEFVTEGPFGDHTGFYSLEDKYPKFHVTCITHKKDAIYPATIVGIPPQEDTWIAKATERIFLSPIKISIAPEIIDMILPKEGVAHNLAIVKIQKKYPGHAIKVANTLWGAGQMMFNKVMIIVDEACDFNERRLLMDNIFSNVNMESDIYISRGPLDVLDHTSLTQAIGGKICIDATTKLQEEKPAQNNYKGNNKPLISQDIVNEIFPFENSCNIDLANQYPILLMGIDEEKTDIAELIQLIDNQIIKIHNLEIIYIALVDQTIPILKLSEVFWFFLGNFDPEHDLHIIKSKDRELVIFDGTSKYCRDRFRNKRWPNIIVSDDKTISDIDKKWKRLNLGEFIRSPSLEFKKLVKSTGASIVV